MTETDSRKSARSGGRGKKDTDTVQPLFDSFRHAFDGILTGLGERNMKIHCLMAVLVVAFGFILRISITEWCICLVLFGNTAPWQRLPRIQLQERCLLLRSWQRLQD